MFKLVVLSALLAVAAAAPGYYASQPLAYAASPYYNSYSNAIYKQPLTYAAPLSHIYEPSRAIVEVQPEVRVQSIAKVGEYVEHVPTSVSHHSSSVVHDSAAIVKPIVQPVQKTVISTAPVYQHSAPLFYSSPYLGHGAHYY